MTGKWLPASGSAPHLIILKKNLSGRSTPYPTTTTIIYHHDITHSSQDLYIDPHIAQSPT